MANSMTALEVTPGYEPLYKTLHEAAFQASRGKGSERHAGGKAFIDQPIFTIAREHGLAFLTGQAAKKLGEAHTLLSIFGEERAIAELYGAIVYTAAAALLLKEQSEKNLPRVDKIPEASVSEVVQHCIESLG